jgi:dethiobiotin synthetase
MAPQALFITATGTGIGKTLVTTGLTAALLHAGLSVAVYKPIQTGSLLFGQPKQGSKLSSETALDEVERSDLEQIKHWLDKPELPTVCTYEFPLPVAPYAADPQRQIQIARILKDFRTLQSTAEIVLIEGAGGIRVPIAPHYEMLDLMADLAMPILLVASPQLGAINHILLSIAALEARQLPIAGLVLSGGFYPGQLVAQHPDPALRTLEETLLPFLNIPYLGWLPDLSPLEAGLFQPKTQAFDAFLPLYEQLFP